MDPRILSGIGPAARDGSAAFLARLDEVAIGLSVEGTDRARRLALHLADSLVRLFTRFASGDAIASGILEDRANWVGRAIVGTTTRPDLAIVVGDAPAPPADRHLFVGAHGWRARLSRQESQVIGDLGLGHAAASFLAVNEVFKILFSEWIEPPVELIDELNWSLFDWSVGGDAPGPVVESLDVGDLVWVGAGAVAHGAFSAVPFVPSLRGQIDLIDPDPYGEQSALRYPGARVTWVGQQKPDAVRDELLAGRGLVVRPHALDMNTWFERERADCVVPLLVVTLDSKEARRQAALKLPRVAVSGWADRFRIGVETFPFRPGRCLACAYPIDQEALSETAVYTSATGLKPSRVQWLLDHVAILDEGDIATIANQTGIAADLIRGKPLRSVRQVLCAVGRLANPATGEAVDVPLGFVAGLAGVATLSEIIRFAMNQSSGQEWNWDARLGLATNAWRFGPSDDCFVCADPDYARVFEAKYRSSISAEAVR